MRTGLLLICISILLAACKQTNRIPAGIIPPKKMQVILWDMMRADLFVGDFVLRQDSGLDKKTESNNLYSQVFAIHQISKEQFGKSFSFYKEHPALFKVIMDSLSLPKTETPTEMIKQLPGSDSLQSTGPGVRPADSLPPLRKKKMNVAE